jgi:glutamate--cysteine ligase
MRHMQPLGSEDDVASVFTKTTPAKEQVGVEVETAALDPETGCSVPYQGERGLGVFLALALDELGGNPQFEREHLVGLQLTDGSQISLENGGAVEYSSPPSSNVSNVMDTTYKVLKHVAAIAEYCNIALVPGANYPFTTVREACWVPSTRGEVMRRYFAADGIASAGAHEVMALTVSTQATFDYGSPRDLAEKLSMQSAASTVAAAMFVNSPIAGGSFCGGLSRRMECWNKVDPSRTGPIPLAIDGQFTVGRFIEWALSRTMIYRKKHSGDYESVSRKFSALLAEGFADGSMPTEKDWLSHLSQIYTDVRVRRTLEVRTGDGPPYSAVSSVPAFWTGLTYHRPSCVAAWELLCGATLEDHLTARRDIARRGMSARFSGQPVSELAAELLRLSDNGLQARIDAGLESKEVLTFLDPLREIVATGTTFADQCVYRWENDFSHSPKRYVDAFRI